ncbi:MAG: hypothetical protein JXB47_02495 [Anaerolineae bacterium]|nr:hypothetical protein [Anaerolineae bacterium]
MSQASALYHLQSLDLEIAARRARLDEINAALGEDKVVRKAQLLVKRTKDQLGASQARVTDLGLEIESIKTRYQESEIRLYSGKVKNPKELQDIQQEIASLKRRHAQLEDNLLESMMRLDDHQARFDKALKKLKRVKTQWEDDQAALAAEKTALGAQLATLGLDRAAAWEAMDGETQAVYDDTRARKGDQPVSLLQPDDTCSLCGVRQTSHGAQLVRRGNSLVRCAGCERVLFVK